MDESRKAGGSPSSFELPVIAPGTQAYTCSKLCQGGCCKYFSLQIDTPRKADDFDAIRWYLTHEDTHVYKYEGDWFLMVYRRCRHLQLNNLCGIYEKRPGTCKDYDPSDCEYTGEIPFDLYFRDDAELEAWLAKQAVVRSTRAKKAARGRKMKARRAKLLKTQPGHQKSPRRRS